MFGCPVEPHKDFSHVSIIASNLFLTDEVACVCAGREKGEGGRTRKK